MSTLTDYGQESSAKIIAGALNNIAKAIETLALAVDNNSKPKQSSPSGFGQHAIQRKVI